MKQEQYNMKILVIDAQGGGVGKQLVTAVKKEWPSAYVMAVGTNSAASMAMLKAGADHAATGENPVVTACRSADIIVGPVGIIIADAMFGEVTARMAAAVAQSSAVRILLPFNQCGTIIAGTTEAGVGTLVQKAVEEIKKVAADPLACHVPI